MLVGLQVYDVVLMRETEERLISQAVVYAEVWREAWAKEAGVKIGSFKPPNRRGTYFPWEPQIDLSIAIQKPVITNLPVCKPQSSAVHRAASSIEPALVRAQIFNLSGTRIIDADGCVVASSQLQAVDTGLRMSELTEVRQALIGHYGVSARRRRLQQPLPPLDSLSRRGRVQIFVAIPVFVDNHVIGVVRMARTSVSTLEYLFKNRRGLLVFLGVVVSLMFTMSMLSYRAIARPVRAIADRARAIAQGKPRQPLTAHGFVPREIDELSQILDQMTDQLTARADYVTQFTADATHELRTPIAAISGASELLKDSWEVMTEQQRMRFISNIEADAKRMERLVARLLTLARIENPPSLTAGQTTNVLNLFDVLAAYYQGVAFVLQNPPAQVAIEEEHLESAVRNLIENALRYGKHVTVIVGHFESRLLVEVKDDGHGIPKEHIARIFERFYTTTRDQGGSGLGLAIVKAVVDNYHGSIDVESSPGETAFRLVL